MLFTSHYLKNKAKANFANESVLFSEQRKSTDYKFDVFLSHSFLDRDEVLGIYRELTALGFSVYVDWLVDSHLDRTNVTKQTAELIRKRLMSSKTLLLAISTNADLSKWMPWELGYVDGNTNRCAIIPVSKDNRILSTFHRREYLLLYPYLDRDQDTEQTTHLWINEDETTYVKFKDWVGGQNPYSRI